MYTDCKHVSVCLQGIYRVNGVKTRVEKLCQAFENGKELVELSQASPHDISNVLKLYLRQVSESPHTPQVFSDLDDRILLLYEYFSASRTHHAIPCVS